MIKIAIDTNIRNLKQTDPVLNLLHQYHNEGLIEIVVAQSYIEENKDTDEAFDAAIKFENIKEPFVIGFGHIGSAYISDGKPRASVKEISSVLFPDFSLDELNRNQKNDVMHIVSCIHKEVEYFVTRNKYDFIATKRNNLNRNDEGRHNDKRIALEKLGINILTPEEMVEKIKSNI
ncbi:MAG: hypothetical protein AB7V36_01475 [Bacteroidales bacterium]